MVLLDLFKMYVLYVLIDVQLDYVLRVCKLYHGVKNSDATVTLEEDVSNMSSVVSGLRPSGSQPPVKPSLVPLFPSTST